MNISDLKSALKQLGAKTSGSKQQLEKRLSTWKEHGLEKTLFEVDLMKCVPSEEFPTSALFKPLNTYSGTALISYDAIHKWFSDRRALKGMQKGRILAIKLFIKYSKTYIDGNKYYLQCKCCVEQRKTFEYNVKIKVVQHQSTFEIAQCQCTCPAGTGWSAACKHIGAFCFSLEYFSISGNTQEYVSCTSQPMEWNKPIVGRGIDVMSIFEITGRQRNSYTIRESDPLVNNLINNNISCPLTNKRKANLEGYTNDHFGLVHMGNAATDYGNSCESLARQVYQCQYGQVHSTGLLINPSIPWLGFSPDGLKMHSGVIYKLIEIKCPVLGKTSGVEGFISELPYLKYDNQQLFPYCLNTNHKYYGQVQLAMFLLNIELCDFVIFSSFDNSIFVIEVERDDVFLQALITKLHYVYFRYYLKMLSS
ncbi:uncharacterized protein LOC116163977 [Photinus pyralis]|uniref:uncharacterized protein LOC116161071 n=2 Tax=Photinus pyralis TaxID=7054 RepID=UPI0012674DA4|nr:uncharacterized protein LOC116161071 [Photinus pyralis]XP_031333964.1 uncharacterized protein LOC116163977 [Photinus pyralis]